MFTEIFAQRGWLHLKAVFADYGVISGRDMATSVADDAFRFGSKDAFATIGKTSITAIGKNINSDVRSQLFLSSPVTQNHLFDILVKNTVATKIKVKTKANSHNNGP